MIEKMKNRYFLIVLFLLWGLNLFGKVVIRNVRVYTYTDHTRVVLDLSQPIKVKELLLSDTNQYRLYFDIKNSTFSSKFPYKFRVRKGINLNQKFINRIRFAKRKQNIRVVLDLPKKDSFSVSYRKFLLPSPYRLVFDIYYKNNGQQGALPDNLERKEKRSDIIKRTAKDISIAKQFGVGVRRIIIDAGHGGKDPGAINKRLKLKEKNITLDIALRLRRILLKNLKNCKVYLTRDKDFYVGLWERSKIANKLPADIFISIHINSSKKKSSNGISTYYLNITEDPEAIRVASRENKNNNATISDIPKLINRILKNTKISESRLLAKVVQTELLSYTRTKYKRVKSLGVKKAPFVVLLGTKMPAILVESSFISNTAEAKRLKTDVYRETIAQGVYRGIKRYINILSQ